MKLDLGMKMNFQIHFFSIRNIPNKYFEDRRRES